jgi:hypothetical protein
MMARRIPGEFVPCDVNLSSDPAIMRAGPMAELLFRRANEHAKRAARDGVIYKVELPLVAHGMTRPERLADALVANNLWIDEGEHWSIRSFLKWNLSQAEQQAEREKKQAAAILGNHKKHHQTERSADCPHCEVAA